MGILTERVGQGLDALGKQFDNRLKSWLANVISFGFDVFMRVLAKSYSSKLTPLITSIRKSDKVPPELKPLFDEIMSPTGESGALLGASVGNAFVGGAIGRLADALLMPLSYDIMHSLQPYIVNPDLMISWYRRGHIDLATLKDALKQHGFTDDAIDILIESSEVRFPSDLVAPAWLRDKAKYEAYWNDVRILGVTEDRVNLLKELAYHIPGVQDVIRFAVREVYTPEIAEKFGQYQDYPTKAEKDAEATGIRPDDLKKYWAAHWELPGVQEGFDLLHRGLIDEETLKLLLRARDVMPFWRDNLIKLSWNLPNRIELRMMARYGLVDKPYIMKLLEKLGLAPEYRSDVADMNIAVGILTDLRTRYRNLYITAEQVRSELTASGLSPQVTERLYQYIVKVEKPGRTTIEKDLTKAELVKGVKLGFLTWEQGVDQLMALGYDREEAIYILAINIEVAAGSPHNVGDFKRLTELHRSAQGLSTERTKEEIERSEKMVAEKYPQRVKLSDEEVKTRVDTARRKRRRGELSHDEEITELLKIGVPVTLATAYAENDDLRVKKESAE